MKGSTPFPSTGSPGAGPSGTNAVLRPWWRRTPEGHHYRLQSVPTRPPVYTGRVEAHGASDEIAVWLGTDGDCVRVAIRDGDAPKARKTTWRSVSGRMCTETEVTLFRMIRPGQDPALAGFYTWLYHVGAKPGSRPARAEDFLGPIRRGTRARFEPATLYGWHPWPESPQYRITEQHHADGVTLYRERIPRRT